MSWQLDLYRRVGQPVLTPGDAEAVLASRPGWRAAPVAPEDAAAGALWAVSYDRLPPGALVFTGWSEPMGANQPAVDFPFEPTPLTLELDAALSADEVRQGSEEIVQLCREMQLLVHDPQRAGVPPGEPTVEGLERDHSAYGEAVESTRAYLRAQSRRYAGIGLLLLGAALLLLFSGFLGRG